MEPKPTYIGGQAVIEGVMMRGKKMYTLAVRGPENNIVTEKVDLDIDKRNSFFRLPIVRGAVSFVDSLVLGTKIITRSAEIAGFEEDDVEVSKFEKYLEEKLGDRLTDVLMFISVAFSLILGVSLFMVLPVFLGNIIKTATGFTSTNLLSLLEGVMRMLIFLIYIYLISKIKDIQRVFMYHGAEHKTINCFEHGEELNVENVRKYTRLHKRCGTSFLFIVMIISIVFFMLLPSDKLLTRVLTRIIFVPVIAGLSYEVIRWAGKSDSALVNILSKPGLMLQNLTTKEPDDSQIEVAIAAMKGVLESEP